MGIIRSIIAGTMPLFSTSWFLEAEQCSGFGRVVKPLSVITIALLRVIIGCLPKPSKVLRGACPRLGGLLSSSASYSLSFRGRNGHEVANAFLLR